MFSNKRIALTLTTVGFFLVAPLQASAQNFSEGLKALSGAEREQLCQMYAASSEQGICITEGTGENVLAKISEQDLQIKLDKCHDHGGIRSVQDAGSCVQQRLMAKHGKPAATLTPAQYEQEVQLCEASYTSTNELSACLNKLPEPSNG